jgi:hypothetical protein
MRPGFHSASASYQPLPRSLWPFAQLGAFVFSKACSSDRAMRLIQIIFRGQALQSRRRRVLDALMDFHVSSGVDSEIA